MRVILFFCFLFVMMDAVAHEQQQPYSLTHYTDQDGLPQNSVKYIAEDTDGFLWLATEDGVVRFDGKQFTAFNGNIGLQNSRIQHMFPGPKAKFLMARTINAEQVIVREGKALPVPKSRDYNYIFNNDTTKAFPVLGYRRDLRDVEANHYLVPVDAITYYKITKDTIRHMVNGVEQYRLRYRGIDPERLFILDRRLGYMDNNGRFLLFDNRGIHILTVENDSPSLQPSPGAGNKRGIFWNFPAGQQFVYADKSCFQMALVNNTTIRFTKVLEDFDMEEKGIVAVYHDSLYQRTFLGSFTKGLYVCTNKQFRVLKAGSGGEEVFYGQTVWGGDSIVTPGGSIFHGNGLPGKLPLPDDVWSNDKYSITPDSLGNYWYKSYRRLVKLNRQMNAVLWSGVINNNNDDQITCLYAGNAGRLWIGTRYAGLQYLETTAPQPEIRIFLEKLKDISYILGDGKVLWVGTQKGLFRLDLSSRQVHPIKGLENFYIRSLYIPHPGEVWVTTYSNGIFLYRNGNLTSLPVDANKYMATAHCLVPDGKGFLWVTTNKGLFQISYQDALSFGQGERKDLFYLYYGKDQGFNTNEFNGGCEPCAARLQNGDISLPSLDGLVYFSPGSIRRELPDKPIFIDAGELDKKKIDIDSSISLPSKFHHLRLYVSTPYFGDPNNLRLFYSLSGEEIQGPELWLEVSDNRSIEFSSLHSGKYTLKIRKAAGFGRGSFTEKVLVINVEKAFYETTWFRALVTGLLGLLAFLFFRARVEREKRKNHMLEARVAERTNELRETMENLRLSEQHLRTQSFIQQRLTAAMSHDLRTPLQYIMHLLYVEDGHKKELKEEEIQIVSESMYNMFHLVENLIAYMKSLYTGDDSSLELTDLGQLLEQKANIFRKVSAARNVRVFNDTPPRSLALVNRQLLAIVVHNLLDNAVKYTRKGYIRLKASVEAEGIHIQFIDTGIGMPEEMMMWLNHYRKGMSVTEQKPPSYDGMGLMMVVELLQLINGSIHAQRHDGGGTVIDIRLAVIE